MVTDAEPAGTVAVRMLDPQVLGIVYTGRVTIEMINAVQEEAQRLLQGRTDVFAWVVDTSRAKSFAFAPPESVRRVIQVWRAHGGQAFAVVAVKDFIRMMGTALRFSKLAPIQMFRTQDEALSYLRGNPPSALVSNRPNRRLLS